MVKNDIVVIELVSGARIIGELDSEQVDENGYTLKEPRIVRTVMDPMGRTAVMMFDVDAPYAAKLTTEAHFPPSSVLRKPLRGDEINEELCNSYISSISGIAVASKGDIII